MGRALKIILIASGTITVGMLWAVLWLGMLQLNEVVLSRYSTAPMFGIEGMADFTMGLALGLFLLLMFGSLSISLWLFRDYLNKDYCFDRYTGNCICLKIEDVEQNLIPRVRFHRADDRYLVYSVTQDKMEGWALRVAVLLALIPIIFFFAWDYTTGFVVFIIFITTFLTLNYELQGFRTIIFDRMNGTVTLPGPLLLPKKTIPFDRVLPRVQYYQKFYKGGRWFPGIYFDNGNFKKLVFSYGSKTPLGFAVWPECHGASWGFFVHYMDRNLPLPPGSAFDPYRERDFRRRQSEGFPAPKHPNFSWITDESCGYINGSEQLRRRVRAFPVSHRLAYNAVWIYIKNEQKIVLENHNDLVWTGIYDNYHVLRLHAPLYDEKVIYPSKADLKGCYLVDARINKKGLSAYTLLEKGAVTQLA